MTPARSLCLLAACAVFACSAPSGDQGPTIAHSEHGLFRGEFQLDPALAGSNELDFSLSLRGVPLSDAEVTIELWMPAHAHQNPVQPAITDLGDGHYLAEDVVLNMPGTWQCRIDVSHLEHQDHFLIRAEAR